MSGMSLPGNLLGEATDLMVKKMPGDGDFAVDRGAGQIIKTGAG